MLTYNTQLKKLILPEYGRNIQRMVGHCLTIEDREERTQCARSVIKAMGNLFPELRNPENNDQKLWDHLMIMSEFKLDIDFPCEVITAEMLSSTPDPVKRVDDTVRYKQYGRYLPIMIKKAAAMPEDDEERMPLILAIAEQMKKLLLPVTRDGVDDEKIFRDLYELSDGAIRLDPSQVQLHEFQENVVAGKKKKKK